MIFGLLALIFATAFAGVALYISFAEQPARLKLIAPSALIQWKTAYARGFLMQAGLAALAGLLGLIAFFYGWYWRFLLGAVVILANYPFTFYFMMPINRSLQATDPASATEAALTQIGQWGWWHLVRGGLGVLAAVIYLWACMNMLQLVPEVRTP